VCNPRLARTRRNNLPSGLQTGKKQFLKGKWRPSSLDGNSSKRVLEILFPPTLSKSRRQILLFRVGDKSLVPSDDTEPGADGSFCARDLRPGKYVVLFRAGPDESPDLFAFYPGVLKPSEATEVEVAPGETVSHLLFRVLNHQTYTVSGKISAFNKSMRQAEPKVMLVSAADRFLLALGYSTDVASDGTFPFRQVLPGKYWAAVTVDSGGTTKWSTRKVEVSVDGEVTDLSLELFAN
jgi:hypothetical protein